MSASEKTAAPSVEGSDRGLLWASAVVNGLLLIAWVYIGRRTSAWDTTDGTGKSGAESTQPKALIHRPSQSGASSAASRKGIWLQMASTNLLAYGANLREAGCPESTICDILRWEINQSISARIAAVQNSGDFWATGKQRREIHKRIAAERLMIRADEEKLYSSLPCAPVAPFDNNGGFSYITDLAIGYLGATQERQIKELISKATVRAGWWSEKEGRGTSHTGPYLLKAELEALRREIDQVDAQVAAIASPDQLKELSLRMFHVTNHDLFKTNGSLDSLHLTPFELRRLCELQAEGTAFSLGDWNPLRDVLPDTETAKNPADNEAALLELLGPERLMELHRQTDPNYHQIKQMLGTGDPNGAVADQAFAMVEQAVNAVAQWKAKAETDPSAARQGMALLRQGLLQQLNQLLTAIPLERRAALVENWSDNRLREQWKGP